MIGAIGITPATPPVDREKVLPLPGWLVKVYFIFPVVLYIPDAIFNYYVYSDGAKITDPNPVFQAGQIALWGFLSVGVVGMAYLLSVLAPWHWGQGHKMQAFFCGLGVLIATGITTWNSLSFRSEHFSQFPTDQWAYQIFPGLQSTHISLTMVLVAIAPPFWGLFWAIVQPTQTGRSLAQLQESHAERLLRMQQEAELKRLRAETNAKIREAQLKGMARTAAAAREQASGLFGQRRGKNAAADGAAQPAAEGAAAPAEERDAAATSSTPPEAPAAPDEAPGIVRFPQAGPSRGREMVGGRASFMNSVAPAQPAARPAPAKGGQPIAAQAALFSGTDVLGSGGRPAGDALPLEPRRPPTLGAFSDVDDADSATGTSGPRHAIRRPTDISPLMRGLGELHPTYAQAVQEAMRELNPKGARKSIPAKELAALVARKLDVDEAMAQKIINRYREQQRNAPRS